MQTVCQNNKEQRIWNFKAVFITEQIRVHVRKVIFVTTWSFGIFNHYFLGRLLPPKKPRALKNFELSHHSCLHLFFPKTLSGTY